MKKITTLSLILISFVCRSQTYFQNMIESDIKIYLDSVGVKWIDRPEECECKTEIDAKFCIFLSKKEAFDENVYRLVFDDLVDDSDIIYYTNEIKKILKRKPKEVTRIGVVTSIKKRDTRFNIFHLSWKVKYIITLTIYTNPIK